MIKIFQTRFGGLDKPTNEQGNCFQACIASILEIPLKEAFDCTPYGPSEKGTPVEKDSWYVDFNKWLAERGLASIYLECSRVVPAVTQILGYHLAEVKSTTLKNGESHCVVIHNGNLVHDPNPNSKANLDYVFGVYLIVPLDVGNWKNLIPQNGNSYDQARMD